MASLAEIQNLLAAQTAELKTAFKGDIESAKAEIMKTVESNTDKIKYLEAKVTDLNEKEKARSERELQLERNAKKNNMLMYKLAENESSQDELYAEVLKTLKIVDSNFVMTDFDFMFRLGKRVEGKTRPILIRFISQMKKEIVIKNKKKLAEKNVDVGDDIPKEIRERRKTAISLVNLLKEKGYNSFLKGDKILVNGNVVSTEEASKMVSGAEDDVETDADDQDRANKKRKPSLEENNGECSQSLQSSTKKPPLKMPKNQKSMASFFSPNRTTAPRSPIVIVKTPSKNVQHVDIIHKD
ncbi:hypothetical protein ACFFRR_000552 [Megaselia abdita]